MIGKKETGLQEKTLAKLTVSAVLLVAAVLVLSGISKRGDLIYETPRFARGLQNGTYSAQKENQFSTVRVDMTITDDRIEDCRITSSGPADLMTDEIRSAWANAIVEGQDPAPEAITGATLVFSAASVQEAVRDILAQAAVQEQTAAQPQDGSAPDTEPEASSQAVLAEPDPDRLMRERPAVTAQPAGADRAAGGAVADPAAKQVSETETGDSERMMRERPAEAPAEPEAAEPSAEADDLPEAEPEVNTAEAGDPERLMRERPAEAPAEPEAAEPSAEADSVPDAEPEANTAEAGDPERLMRTRPAGTAAEPAGESEVGTETAEEPSVTEEVLRLMRRRP